MIRRTILADSPARGGSTTSTSGRPACSASSRSAARRSRLAGELAQREADVAREEPGVGDLVAPRVGDRVGDRLLDDLEPPQLPRPRREREADRPDPAEQ